MKGIKNILIVDDILENIEAAKNCFNGTDFVVTYARSEEQAKKIISQKMMEIDLVITDLEMEQKLSGCYVMIEALKFGVKKVIIATGRGSEFYSEGHGHGPKTQLFSLNKREEEGGYRFKTILRKKDKEGTWEEVMDNVLKNVEVDGKIIERMKKIEKKFKYEAPFSGKYLWWIKEFVNWMAYGHGWVKDFNEIPGPIPE